jgi:hypothetical protein
MSRTDLARPEVTCSMRSLYPNHVHQIDSSVCVMYDFKGKKRLITRDMQTEFYKGKPGFWRKVKKVILRYICVDHATGWFYVRYYYAEGESFSSIFDFATRAWGKKADPDIFPAHGVPEGAMLDKGAANMSQYFRNFLKNLKVQLIVHVPGKPWINGAVESMHAFWERSFEGDLSFLAIEDIDELNRRAEDKCCFINAFRRHKRHGRTRFEAFAAITREQLRVLPSLDVCRKLCYADPRRVTVGGPNEIRYEGKSYRLGSTFRRGDKLWARFNPYDYPAVEINTQENFAGEAISSTLVQRGDLGFDVRAPIVGREYQGQKKDAIDRAKSVLKHINLDDVIPQLQAKKMEGLTWMPKKGTDLIPAAPVIVPPMVPHEARKRLREDLGIERFTTLQSEWIDGRLPAGSVTDAEYERVREEYKERFIEAIPARRGASLKIARKT